MREILKERIHQKMKKVLGPIIDKAITAICVTKETNEKLKVAVDIILAFLLGLEIAAIFFLL